MFLDGIHSDDLNSSDANVVGTNGTSIGTTIHGTAHMVQSQPNVIGGQLQVHIPTHFQGSLGNNTVQQVNSGTVTYLTPSGTSHVSTASRLQNVVPAAGQQVTSSVGQAQSNAKLVQIAPTFPLASVQQLNSVPIQTLLQPNQTLTSQTIYGGQGTGMFPTQGSVHIENPKVVNVNFGPHVIGSDGSGQPTIIQTAEGKRVLITNSHMSQSISLSPSLVGAHLINPGGGNVIRASMAPGTTATRQIVLPTASIPQHANAQQAGLTKNVVLNSGISPVIYQSGQSGHLIQSQPTLITSSGTGIQVVNTGGNQGNQVQLINQSGIGQRNAFMNFINNQNVIPNAGSHITGIVPGQNIIVNGQMLNISQIRGLAMPQLQVQSNSQGGVTLSNVGATRQTQFQPTAQHVVIQNGQQQIMLQSKNTSSPALMTAVNQRHVSNVQGGRIARTPTPNTNSASSTPVATPTPSTPTPTPTPDLMPDYGGQGSKMSSILEQALEMSDIDLNSFEDDFTFFENTPASQPQPEITAVKSKPQPQTTKTKSKSNKPKSKSVTVPNNTVSFQQPKAQVINPQGLKVTLSPEQQFISGGQVYVLSANGQQLILQSSANKFGQQAKALGPQTSSANMAVSQVSISSSNQSQQAVSQSNQTSLTKSFGGQFKLNQGNTVRLNQNSTVLAKTPEDNLVRLNQNSTVLTKTPEDNKLFNNSSSSIEESVVQNSQDLTQIVTSSQPVHSRPPSSYTFSTTTTSNSSQSLANQIPVKNQKYTTLAGTFIKQEPVTQPVKQEPFIQTVKQEHFGDTTDTIIASQTLAQQQASSYSPTVVTTSVVMTTALPAMVSSASSLATSSTSTTQAHQSTIMTSSPMLNASQASFISTSVHLPRSTPIFCETSSVLTTAVFTQALSSPTFSTASTSSLLTNSKTTSIANSTLMLSLTRTQKERLEDHLSNMTLEEQNNFLIHQQNIIRRSQQVQQKQLEQQQKYQQQQKQQQIQQKQQQPSQQHMPPQQSQQIQQHPHSFQGVNVQNVRLANSSEYLSPQPGTGLTSLPATVQELIDKPEETRTTFQEQPQQFRQQQVTVSQPSSQPPSVQQLRIVSDAQINTPLQNYVFPPMGRCLAEQQLLRDKTLAVSPDVNSPFKSLSDAMRRLVRYHTLQDHKPEDGSKQIRKWDSRYSKMCDYLVKKKRHYLKRFHKMKLMYDMCPEKSPEYIQNLYCFNEQLQDLIDREKEEVNNWPGTFEPLHTDLQAQSSYLQPATPLKFTDIEKVDIADQKFDVQKKEVKKLDVKLEHTEFDVKSERSDSPYSSPSGVKRKLPEKSTGTLKFVFKRRTTDNFVVKNSMDGLPQDFKPVVNLEKSDSEYEFDSHSAVSNNHSVIVRRRTSSMSITSRQTSFEAGSESSSSNKGHGHSSCEEDESSHSEDDEEEEEKNTDDVEPSASEGDEEDEEEEDCGSLVEKKRSKCGFRVSFGDNMGVENSGDGHVNNEDAFMESYESNGRQKYKHVSNFPKPKNFGFLGDKIPNLKKSQNSLSVLKPVSCSNSGLSNEFNVSDISYSFEKKLHSSQFSFSADNAQSTFQQSALHVSPHRRKECVSRSPSSVIGKTGAERGLPIFTTPNKNLLQTDAMFNSSEDEDGGNCRSLPSFEIDNKDPQNSMMNDSVRSAINSVLNDDDNDDSQTSWSSSAHRPPSSSSAHHSLFQSSSPAIVHGHDADLDAAVQSIMND
ncbi:hypothetical protein Btru_045637 [Bulinus truncatus]|nr:hypothetical protein Btru_045637 [Bulinus truncatus]